MDPSQPRRLGHGLVLRASTWPDPAGSASRDRSRRGVVCIARVEGAAIACSLPWNCRTPAPGSLQVPHHSTDSRATEGHFELRVPLLVDDFETGTLVRTLRGVIVDEE